MGQGLCLGRLEQNFRLRQAQLDGDKAGQQGVAEDGEGLGVTFIQRDPRHFLDSFANDQTCVNGN